MVILAALMAQALAEYAGSLSEAVRLPRAIQQLGDRDAMLLVGILVAVMLFVALCVRSCRMPEP